MMNPCPGHSEALPQQLSGMEVVAECSDGFEGIKAIAMHQPDFIFLDIQMPKISGFEMLELIEKHPAVIFTTAFDEYAIKAFEVNAVDYLLKPIEQRRFEQAMQKLPARLSRLQLLNQELCWTLQHGQPGTKQQGSGEEEWRY
jgi:two-component system LytT family response regulator